MTTQTPGEKKNIHDLLKEKDAFFTTSEKCYEFFLRHTRGFIMVGVAVSLIVVGVAIYFNSQKKAEVRAVLAYESALSLIADHRQNLTVPIEALEKVRLDYKGRKVYRLAAFDLVGLYGAQGDSARALVLAEELLQTLKQGEMSLKPLLLNTLGGLYELSGDYIKASKSYQVLLGMATKNQLLKEDVLMSLGRVAVAAKETPEALKYYQTVLAEFPRSNGALWANYQLARLTGQAVAFPLGEVEEVTVAVVEPEPAAAQSESDPSESDSSESEVVETSIPAQEILATTAEPQNPVSEPVESD